MIRWVGESTIMGGGLSYMWKTSFGKFRYSFVTLVNERRTNGQFHIILAFLIAV